MSFDLHLDEVLTPVAIVDRAPFVLRIGDRLHEVRENPATPGTFSVTIDGATHEGFRYVAPDRVWIRLFGRTCVTTRGDAAGAGGGKGAGRNEIRADMPGTIVTLHVKAGQSVTAGDPVLTLESMKLQITVMADHDATVASLLVAEGATFERGATLVTFGEKS